VLPVAAIYGANASGKSAVIKAFEFLVNAVKFSHTQWQPDQRIPVDPFAGDGPAAPSEFAVDFLLAGIRHQYGFAANSDAILREWLYVYPKGKRQLWFSRVEGSPISFGAKMPGENKMIEGLTRKNSLFLSAAAQNNHEALLHVQKWFSEALSFGTSHLTYFAGRAAYGANAAQFCQDEPGKAVIVRLLSHADLGIAGLSIEEAPWPEFGIRLFELLLTEAPSATFPETNKTIRSDSCIMSDTERSHLKRSKNQAVRWPI